MTLFITRPIRFYQVKNDKETLSDICKRFEVSPDKVEKEIPGEELRKGEMLVLHTD
jgi:hypothetical protein